jgi:hypothetical protein
VVSNKDLGAATIEGKRLRAPEEPRLMTENLAEFAKDLFKSAQHPRNWLSSAERLHDAAEAILKHELGASNPKASASSVSSIAVTRLANQILTSAT